MKKIYLIDYIGRHGNTDIFLREYASFLEGMPGVSAIEILSNFSNDDNRPPFFLNHYEGKILKQIFSLYKNFHRLKHFIDRHPDDIYIYISYGNWIDEKFINILGNASHKIVDILALHSMSDQHPENYDEVSLDKSLVRILNSLAHQTETVICHSDSVANTLSEAEVPVKIIKMPSLNYRIYQHLTPSNLSNDFAEISDSPDIDTMYSTAKADIISWTKSAMAQNTQ